MADTSVPHVKKVKLYLNGDPNFIGKFIVVNPRYYRNFESFLDTATWTTQSANAVTRICTPQGRHTIDSVEKLTNGSNYVAVGRERFKKLKYGEAKLRSVAGKLPPVWRSQLPSSGRFLKVYEGEKQAMKRIYVYRNGDNKTPARMILLKRRTLTDMELVLAALQESNMNFDFAISKLFTLKGKQVYSCDEIRHDGKYVALERGSRFKPINYEGVGSLSPRNRAVTYLTRLPPIPTARSNQSKVSYSPRKNPPPITHKLAPTKQKNTQQTEIKLEEKIVVNRSLPDSILSSFDDGKRESFSHVSLSVTPPALDESPDFTLSESIQRANEVAKETVEKNASQKVDIPRDLDELPDQQQESIGLKLYNASGMQQEWGDMIVENKNTVIDKLIDDVPAEEIVDEDITEITEGTQENVTITEKVIDTVKEKLIDDTPAEEIVDEDVTEITEDTRERIKTSESESSENNNDANGLEEETSVGESVEEVIIINDNHKKEERNEEPIEQDDEKGEESEDDDDDKEDSTSPEVPLEKPVPQSDEQRSKSEEPEQEQQDEESGDEDEKDKEADEQEAAESPQQSRRSSQDMNSEDEVRSEDEEEEDNDDDDKDDDDDNDDEKSNDDENNESTNEAIDEKHDESNDDDASNTEPSSAKEDSEADEPAAKENKTNKKVEEQRADPEAAKKKDIKQNNDKIKRKEKRIDNKA